MEHTGHIRIGRKVIPYYLKDKQVHLIPNNTYASLIPGEVNEKEMIKGVTTENREVAFVGCRYNNSLAEKYKNALTDNWEYIQPVADEMSRIYKVEFPSASETGKVFAEFRNGIAHGNSQEIGPLHVVLFEVARALIYTMVLKKANADRGSIKAVINKLF